MLTKVNNNGWKYTKTLMEITGMASVEMELFYSGVRC